MWPVCRSSCNRRDAPRCAGGSCAMSSGGRSKSNSRTSTPASVPWLERLQRKPVVPQVSELVNRLAKRQFLHWIPIRREDRPQGLIVIHAVPQERPVQHAFLRRAQLVERAVASPVL